MDSEYDIKVTEGNIDNKEYIMDLVSDKKKEDIDGLLSNLERVFSIAFYLFLSLTILGQVILSTPGGRFVFSRIERLEGVRLDNIKRLVWEEEESAMYVSNSFRADKNSIGPTIAIDGPAGAGKSTIAKAVAKAFGLAYVSTGLIYRALTLKMLRLEVDVSEIQSVVALTQTTKIEVIQDKGECRILLDGEDVTEDLTNPDIGAHVSKVAEISGVRAALLDIQRDIGNKGSVVMEGRDIGTVVMPNADVKIFLVADFNERVRRRVIQAREQGCKVMEETIISEIMHRDKVDSGRTVAPLRPAPDSVTIDTTGKAPDETVNEVASVIRLMLSRDRNAGNLPKGKGRSPCST